MSAIESRWDLDNAYEAFGDYFNCGGYALGCFQWYLPYEWGGRMYEMVEELGYERMLEHCVGHMLHDSYLRDLRVLGEDDVLEDDERLILFRIGDYDFHYIVQSKHGEYFHKQGWGPIEPIDKEIVEGGDWDFGEETYYDSDIVRLAITVDEELLWLWGFE